MGLRSGLPHLGSPRRCIADLAAPIQLAPAAQQPKSKSAHQPPRSNRGQPVEAPQLAASGLSPSRLELEITESVLMQNDEATLAMLHQLRTLGVRIAMDDFGTG